MSPSVNTEITSQSNQVSQIISQSEFSNQTQMTHESYPSASVLKEASPGFAVSTDPGSSQASDSSTDKLVLQHKKLTAKDAEDITDVLLAFLRDIDVKYPKPEYDDEFAKSCCEDALNRYGFQHNEIDSPSFQLALHASVAIAITAYAHLQNKSTQRWICLYTACMIYFDDLSQIDPSSVREFNMRFISGQSQAHPLLNNCANLLIASWEHLNTPCANLIVSAALDFITSLFLEFDHQQTVVHKSAKNYPRYFRNMMGMGMSYTAFIFPPHIPFENYVQAIPDIINVVNDMNDIFSFYKEELANENMNHISLASRLNGCSKLDSLKDLAAFTVEGRHRVKDILAAHSEAYDCFIEGFVPGYVAFHALADKRYKLHDLKLL